jgi:hypothetical protein
MESVSRRITVEVHDEVARGMATADLDFTVDAGGVVGVAGSMRDAEGDAWLIPFRTLPAAHGLDEAAGLANDVARRALKERRDARGAAED